LDTNTKSQLDEALFYDGITHLIIDLENCQYVSSAGLRSILSAKKAMDKLGGEFFVTNVPVEIYEVFNTTGFTDIMNIAKALREISLEGLEYMAECACGECYRLNDEEVVKMYKEGFEFYVAENEKQRAKIAFILGVPTAISYDMVKCGKRFGVVYELLNAEMLSTVLIREPEKMDEYAKLHSELLKTFHVAKPDKSMLEDVNATIAEALEAIREYFTADEIEKLKEYLSILPKGDVLVHYDLHTNNVMVQDGELIVIDMGELCYGSIYMDLTAVYGVFGCKEVDMCESIIHMDKNQGYTYWEYFAKHYFENMPEEKAFFEKNCLKFTALWIANAVAWAPSLRESFIKITRAVMSKIETSSKLASDEKV